MPRQTKQIKTITEVITAIEKEIKHKEEQIAGWEEQIAKVQKTIKGLKLEKSALVVKSLEENNINYLDLINAVVTRNEGK